MSRLVIITFGIIILIFLSYFACQYLPEPSPVLQPQFSAYPTMLDVGEEASFEDNTQGDVLKREWDFGDGTTTSDSSVVTHAYAEPGKYAVKLTINSRYTNVDTIVVSEAEEPLRNLAINGKKTAKVGESIAFNISGTSNGSNVSWNFGEDPDHMATGRNAQYAYKSPGVYTVTARYEEDGKPAQSVTFKTTIEANPTNNVPSISNSVLMQMLQSRKSIQDFDKYICNNRSVSVVVNGNNKTFDAYYQDLNFLPNITLTSVKASRGSNGCITKITITQKE